MKETDTDTSNRSLCQTEHTWRQPPAKEFPGGFHFASTWGRCIVYDMHTVPFRYAVEDYYVKLYDASVALL